MEVLLNKEVADQKIEELGNKDLAQNINITALEFIRVLLMNQMTMEY